MKPRSLPRAFVPFAVVALVHLATLLVHPAPEVAQLVTKTLLMPTLAIPLVVGSRNIGRGATVGLAIAIALSWVGDITVGMPGAGFIVGLTSFLLALVAYVVVFARFVRARRVRTWAVVYTVWFAGVMIVLLPHVGALAAPIVLYGLALGGVAVASTTGTRRTSLGGALFLVGDTLLSLKLFLPGFDLWEKDFVIMAFYCAGQALLVGGVIAHLRSGDENARTERARDARMSA